MNNFENPNFLDAEKKSNGKIWYNSELFSNFEQISISDYYKFFWIDEIFNLLWNFHKTNKFKQRWDKNLFNLIEKDNRKVDDIRLDEIIESKELSDYLTFLSWDFSADIIWIGENWKECKLKLNLKNYELILLSSLQKILKNWMDAKSLESYWNIFNQNRKAIERILKRYKSEWWVNAMVEDFENSHFRFSQFIALLKWDAYAYEVWNSFIRFTKAKSKISASDKLKEHYKWTWSYSGDSNVDIYKMHVWNWANIFKPGVFDKWLEYIKRISELNKENPDSKPIDIIELTSRLLDTDLITYYDELKYNEAIDKKKVIKRLDYMESLANYLLWEWNLVNRIELTPVSWKDVNTVLQICGRSWAKKLIEYLKEWNTINTWTWYIDLGKNVK